MVINLVNGGREQGSFCWPCPLVTIKLQIMTRSKIPKTDVPQQLPGNAVPVPERALPSSAGDSASPGHLPGGTRFSVAGDRLRPLPPAE